MNQSTLQQSTALNSSVAQSHISKIMNKTFLLSEHDSQMREVLQISYKDQHQSFKNEISMIQGAKDSITSGVYLSNIQKERADQFDVVLAQRKFLWKQEEQLYQQIDDLKKTNKRFQDSVSHYGVRNHNLETEVKQKYDQIQTKLNSVREERKQLLKNFEQIQQNQITSRSKLSNVGQQVLDNPQYRSMMDFINQQEKKVQAMKIEYNDPASNQIIPFDKKLQQMAENTFEKQARFLYQGTKFEGNDQQKLAALSTLRNKIEQYIDDRGLQGVILDMPFKLNMTKEQESAHKVEYNQTLAEIDKIRKDYIQSGGTDPNFLISVNNLERYYKNNHPIGRQEMPDKLNMNLEERGPITQNPIYQYLPQTFQKEILELENQVQIQREADRRNPNLNKELLRNPVDVDDSSKADEMMLENLRQQEISIMLADHMTEENKRKYDEIQKLKEIYEKRFLEKKVQEQLDLKQVEEDVLNFKGRPQDKLNYLQYLQGQIGTMPLHYDPDGGFIVRLDFVNKLPIVYEHVKISYGLFIRNLDEPHTTMTTQSHECTQENIFQKKCIIQERFVERNHEIYKDTYLYLILWCYNQDYGNGAAPNQVGWTLHKVFDEENLISGCFLLPFYNASFTYDLHKQVEIQEIKLGLRISMPGDAVLDMDTKIINIVDYKLQPLHQKQQDVIDLEKQFKFKEYRVFPIPKELLYMQCNNPSLWKSELPPNVYKLMDFGFLNEQQAAVKQQQQEYNERQQNRLNRPNRRIFGKQGTALRGQTDKKRTMLTFKQRLALKKGTTTPNTNKSKSRDKELSQRPDSKADTSRQKIQEGRSTQRIQEKEKSTIMSTKPRKIIFKLRSLSQLHAGSITSFYMKLALFQNIKLIEDDSKNMCVFNKELEPDEKGDNYFNYTETFTFDLNLTNYFQEQNQEDILNTYLFIAIFKDKIDLFGWHALQVFDFTDDQYKIRSGIYSENLYGPPGQAPPFNLNRTKRTNNQINFIIMQDDDRVLQLPTYDNYKLDQKLLTEEDREQKKKLYSVANPKWNTQIRLDITLLKNFSQKEDFIMKTFVLERENIIIDVLDRQCIRHDNIELFEGQGKGEMIVNHTIILRIGTRYLIDTFTLTYKKLAYLFNFIHKNDIIGSCQMNLFTSSGTLNVGQQSVFVHDLDGSGKIGKKTNRQMYFFIQEENLNLNDIEETPKYAQHIKDKQQNLQFDQSKGLVIQIDSLTDYVNQKPVDFTIQIYNGNEPAIDEDGIICAYTSSKKYQPAANQSVLINGFAYFKLPLTQLLHKKVDLDKFYVFISFQDLGWISFQLFLNGQLNSSEFVGKLFQGEVPAPPVDYTAIKKINTKISYSVRFDYKPNQEYNDDEIQESRPQIHKSGTSKFQQSIPSEQVAKIASRRTVNSTEQTDKLLIVLININGFLDQAVLAVKGLLMMDSKPLLDRNNQTCSFKTDKVNNVQKVAFFNNMKFAFLLDTTSLNMESYLFLSVLDESEIVIAWFGRRLVSSVGKVVRGQQFEYLFAPPLMRPPLDKSKITALQQSIQFEIK
ncbi:unnamed protein product [Paramecium octaurelia]|uniref:Uncharacterized protein n=1 Tax=Paramecium octaurelia TaxID=43137 RepID=A0A8S1V3P1_PAROT|nr:unnamed protein product [Paramecium octaurelia]